MSGLMSVESDKFYFNAKYHPYFVLFLALVVYTLYGFNRKLQVDDSVFIYAGQEMARGIPPYVSIFDIKTPIGYLLPGVGVIISNWLGVDNIITVRLIFFIFGCLSVVAVFLLGRRLFNSSLVGIFSSITMLSFYAFGLLASSGPRPKVPMTFFISMATFYTIEKKWFKAGLFGSLSLFTWQPAGIFLLITIIFSLTQGGENRNMSFLSSITGAALPGIIIMAYFYLTGGLYEMIFGGFLFPFQYMQFKGLSLFSQIEHIYRKAFVGFTSSILIFYIGLLMIVYFYYWRFRVKSSITEMLLKDRFSIILLSFPPLVIWSLKDFQGYPDFFIFLPFISLGFGHFLSIINQKIEKTNTNSLRLFKKRFSAIVVILLFSISLTNAYLGRSNELLEQRSAAVKIERQYGEDVKILSLGDPTPLVLLHKTNPNRYLFITRGFDLLIEDTYPGGVEGWLNEIEEYDPSVISFKIVKGEYSDEIIDWIKSNYVRAEMDQFIIYVKKEPTKITIKN
jgi:hypothetical protein